MRWRTQFDARTLKRGLDYAADGRVDPDWAVHQSSTGLELSGSIAGSGAMPYEARVALVRDGERRMLASLCDCPMNFQCKHVAALIQAFLEDMQYELDFPDPTAGDPHTAAAADSQAVERDWTRWLDVVTAAAPGPRGPQLHADRQLGLFVDRNPAWPLPRLVIAAVWLRPSKNRKTARLVDPKPIQWIDERLEPAPPDGWNAVLEEQLMLLLQRRARGYFYGASIDFASLSLPFHARILHALLAADDAPPVFHIKQTGPRLALGPRRTLQTHWKVTTEGGCRLTAELDDEGALDAQRELVVVGNELWYLDPASGVLGPVDGDPRLAAFAKRSPDLPADKVAWLAERMQRTSRLPAGLAPPTAPKTVELPAVPPKLSLRMAGLIVFTGGWRREEHLLGAAWPQFDYGNLTLQADGSDTDLIARGDELIRIRRDPDAEAALLAALPGELMRLDALTRAAGLPPLDGSESDAHTLFLNLSVSKPMRIDDWPLALAAPEQWWPMIARLRRAGVRVELGPDFPPEPRRLTPEDWHGELEPAGNGWFDLGLDIEVEGRRLSLLPILRGLLSDPRFPLEPAAEEPADATWDVFLDDSVLELPLARLRTLLTPIMDWLGDAPEAASVRMPVTAATQLDAPDQRWTGHGRKALRDLTRSLRKAPAAIDRVRGFEGKLRDYQAQGVAWLRWLALLGLGGLLADDMGLGKTIQVLAHVMDERVRRKAKDRKPVLVVATTSLVANWCSEAERFCPSLRVLQLQRPKLEREAALARLGDADLVVTTYPLLVRDLEALKAQPFSLLVLDEAQAIKNAASQTARAVREVPAARRLAMTGTPVENHLGELWAQLDAVAPGFLGSAQWFGQHFRRPIEQHGEAEPLQRLKRRIAPLILRRTRDEVLAELPEKTETQRSVVIAGAQRDLYETLRLAQHERVRQSIEQRGLAGSGIVMLDALLKLRQVCCDPRLVKLDSARSVRRSAKLLELRSLLAGLLEEGRRVLVFSQFTEMLELIADDLGRDGIRFLMLTGQVPGRERKQRIDRFQAGEVPLFLISLKAGGAGLNLTAADTVIHYDPWWNPAVEAQATGRAHRMGQTKPVLVYKLVCAGTVEERITELQRSKADLAASILSEDAARRSGPIMDEVELEALFAPIDAR